MSGFDPSEYEQTNGNYETEPDQSGLVVFGKELDLESRFSTDFSAFCRLNRALYNQAVADLDTEVPDDYISRGNMGIDSDYISDFELLPNAMNWVYISDKVLKSIGYHIVIVAQEADRDCSIVLPGRQVALYQQKGEVNLTGLMIGKNANQWLLGRICDTGEVHDWTLDKADSLSWYNDERLAPLQDTGLLERGFMTGALLKARGEILKPTDSVIIQEHGHACIGMYEDLAKDGYTPLGPEEMYGIAETGIREWLEEHPEHGPIEDATR